MRGSSSSRRSAPSWRSAGSSERASATSCSTAQRLVCLAWKVSCSATPKRAQHVPARRASPASSCVARAEQLVGVEVDPARVELDVAGVREPGPDQRPHRVQALQDPRPVIGEVLVERVEPAALRGGAVQLLHERRRPACGWRPSAGHRARVAVQVRHARRWAARGSGRSRPGRASGRRRPPRRPGACRPGPARAGWRRRTRARRARRRARSSATATRCRGTAASTPARPRRRSAGGRARAASRTSAARRAERGERRPVAGDLERGREARVPGVGDVGRARPGPGCRPG